MVCSCTQSLDLAIDAAQSNVRGFLLPVGSGSSGTAIPAELSPLSELGEGMQPAIKRWESIPLLCI